MTISQVGKASDFDSDMRRFESYIVICDSSLTVEWHFVKMPVMSSNLICHPVAKQFYSLKGLSMKIKMLSLVMLILSLLATPKVVLAEEQLAPCDHSIERFNLHNESDTILRSYLSIATFTVPTGEDSCSYFYTMLSEALVSAKNEGEQATCTALEHSVTCYDTVELGAYAVIKTYTAGFGDASPYAIVQDYTNGESNSWIFFGFGALLPTIRT